MAAGPGTTLAKIGRNAQSGRFVTVTVAKKSPRTHVVETVSIKDKTSGRELPLKGYGSMKGKFVVKKGVDVTKPIAAQAGNKSPTKTK